MKPTKDNPNLLSDSTDANLSTDKQESQQSTEQLKPSRFAKLFRRNKKTSQNTDSQSSEKVENTPGLTHPPTEPDAHKHQASENINSAPANPIPEHPIQIESEPASSEPVSDSKPDTAIDANKSATASATDQPHQTDTPITGTKVSPTTLPVTTIDTSAVLENSANSNYENEKLTTVNDGLESTRKGLLSKIGNIFKGTFNLDDELFDELEETLMSSDIGVQASLDLVARLRERVKSDKIHDAQGVLSGLRAEITDILTVSQQAWSMQQRPYVLVMVGVNGVGKTTTTAKIASLLKLQGKSVMLAAADTFRAAAVEQLQEWGQRLDIPVITQGHGADAAAVAHDALTSANARNIDVLIIDTAGRLHTQTDLMEQLQKVNRVLQKISPDTPHEVMQILDAGTGQNALNQLEHFQKAVGVSSICLTKLDGSAKGGVAIALAQRYKLPIRFIGIGEAFGDLRPFNAAEFADALIQAKNS